MWKKGRFRKREMNRKWEKKKEGEKGKLYK